MKYTTKANWTFFTTYCRKKPFRKIKPQMLKGDISVVTEVLHFDLFNDEKKLQSKILQRGKDFRQGWGFFHCVESLLRHHSCPFRPSLRNLNLKDVRWTIDERSPNRESVPQFQWLRLEILGFKRDERSFLRKEMWSPLQTTLHEVYRPSEGSSV